MMVTDQEMSPRVQSLLLQVRMCRIDRDCAMVKARSYGPQDGADWLREAKRQTGMLVRFLKQLRKLAPTYAGAPLAWDLDAMRHEAQRCADDFCNQAPKHKESIRSLSRDWDKRIQRVTRRLRAAGARV